MVSSPVRNFRKASLMYLKTLNPLQLKATTFDKGPLLILAGAGSGKTKVLTSRIAHLVQKRNVLPGNILAVTFTNKAAQEIKERVEKLIGEKAKEIWAGTFHTIGLRIMREEAKTLGLKSNFTIYDDEEQPLLVNYVMSELGISNKELPYKSVVWEINLAKNNCLAPDEYARHGESDMRDVIIPIYRAYQKKLTAMNAVDFGDLICKPIQLLKSNPDVMKKYQDKFAHILVDEYQDTNKAQYILTRLLASGENNLCAVGDPDQSIYGWRGASIENILKFREDYHQAEIIKLEQNYRSTKSILGAANSVIMNNEDRIEKKLWTQNSDGDPVSFEDGIPYTIVGGYRFFDRKEIKDTIAYLKAVINPEDSLNFLRVVNVPPRGIGKATLEKVHKMSAAHDLSLFEAFVKGRKDGLFADSVNDFIGTFEILRHEMTGTALHEFASRVLDLTGYMDFWASKKTEEADVRVKNLDSLIPAIKNYETGHPKATLADYLNLVSIMSDADQYEDKQNRVTLMTMHSAKGLEFPVVFIAGMEEGR